ncbi:ABC transporter substrate-binding protein [Roseomonas marmotae]|uniref:ABC transporter substrate-binding protein n=1 Tax=Roseomonas marmotae TaxID=2768161 RepID=A0ABS3KDH1_9PROT|nr:ABC transporter substrate-binding protein [Roseomonas marmotae]MBO1075480.1 ABC transporter substrate-binding protein [Roseomonas marmotae]QTI81428.1 ABC transporter substrate-binding protein [Roseomonas marmotae]
MALPAPRRRAVRRLALMAATCLGLLAGAGAQAQNLRVGVQAPFGIDPHFLFVGPNMAAARHIYDSLINRDPESRFVPGIVESWKPLDETTWELKLRQGVTFHDGSPFTAEDVAFSIARVPEVPNNPGPYSSNLRTITGVQVVDPYTVRISTDRPNPTLMGQLTNIFIVSKKAAEGASTTDFTSGKAAIGTGPFRLEQFRNSEGMSLARNEKFWGEKAAYAKVDLRVIGNDAARIAALLSGDVDLIEDVSPTDAARLEKDSRVRVFKRNSDRIMFLIPHVGAEKLALLTKPDGSPLDVNPLRDLRVRRALSLALDRQALAERGMDGQAIATLQMVPEQFGAYDPSLAVPAADPEGARRLLAEAGYPEGFGLTVGCTNNRFVNDARVCQVVGQMLARAGLQAKVETQPSSVFFPRTVYGKNDLPLMLYGLSLSSSRDASYILSTAVHSRNVEQAFGQGNRGSFSDAEMDRIINDAITRMDDGREEALRQAMRAALEKMPIIPLYNQVTIAAAAPGVVYTPRMDEQLVAYHARPAKGAGQ